VGKAKEQQKFTQNQAEAGDVKTDTENPFLWRMIPVLTGFEEEHIIW